MARQEVVILHGPFRELERTTKRGKKRRRVRIDVQSAPLVHEFDDFRLGKGPAEAINDYLREQGKKRSAGKQVSPATQRARLSVLRAYEQGKSWATRQYTGGRTGATPPKEANISRAWFFSGRFLDGLFVRENRSEESWSINVPANRLNRKTFGGDAELKKAFDSLLELLPELGDPRKLLESEDVKAAIRQSIRDLIIDAEARSGALRRRRNQLLLRLGGRITRGLL